MTKKYIYGAGVDEPIFMVDAAGNRYYYFYDGLGSVAALSNANNVIVEAYCYDAFGQVRINVAAGQDGNWLTPEDVAAESAFGNRFMFTGREYDSETGLYYYRARMYSPQLGRFLQPDPIGYADSMNLYQYCGNNPINWIDPWGLKLIMIQFYYNDMRMRQYKGQLQERLQQDFNAIAKGTKDCVRVKLVYRPEDSFYKNSNLGLITETKNYDLYRFGIQFVNYDIPFGVGRNYGDYAQFEWQAIKKASNSLEGLRQVYMHELIWHGDSAMERFFERYFGAKPGDLGGTNRNSLEPLYISPGDAQEIRDVFGME